jgi:hypothetical protein
LVHELTHVLQDQVFDIDSDELEEDSGDASGLRAMLEGDAELVSREFAYEKLDDEELDELIEFQSEGSEVAYGDAPPVLVALLSAPYQLGYSFLDVVMAANGDEARDEALRNPPTSEEQLLDPWAHLDGDDPIDVDKPDLVAGETELDLDASPHFGALTWYAVLAQRVDAREALTSVDGWGGDSYVGFERDGRVCVRARFAGDDRPATDAMAATLVRWVAAGPTGMSTATRHDSYVELESCDQGAATENAPVSDVPILVLPELRSELGASMIGEEGADAAVAGCAANDLVMRVPLETYADLSSSPLTGRGSRQLRSDAISKCGG